MALIGELAVAITGDTSALQAATRRGSEEMKQFARDALQSKRVIESLEGPTDTYARKLKELTRLYEGGHLSADQYTAAQGKLGDELESTQRKMEGVGEAAKGMTPRDAIKAVGEYATAMVGVSNAVGLVRDALQDLHRTGQEGATSIQGLSAARQQLSQVATSPLDQRGLFAQGDRIASRFGIDRAAAASLVFSGRSENFLSDVIDIADAGQLVGVEAAATAGGQFKNLFAREGLTSQQAISATLLAAKQSRASFQDIAAAAPIAAETAGGAGTQSAETLALLSVLSGEFASPKTAADRIKSFNALVGNTEQLKGLGTLGAFRELQALPQDERDSILGDSQERRAVFEKLESLAPQVEDLATRITADQRLTATGSGGLLATQRAIQESSIKFRTARAARRAEVEAEISKEVAGERELLRQAIVDRAQADRNGQIARGGLAGMRAVAEEVGEATVNTTPFAGLVGIGGADRLLRAERQAAETAGVRAERLAEQNGKAMEAMVEELKQINVNTKESDAESSIESFR